MSANGRELELTGKGRRLMTDSLGVDLADVGQSLGQDVARHLVSIFVPELGSLSLSALRISPSVGDGTGHNAANRGGYLEEM